jgi:hypothetical protein
MQPNGLGLSTIYGIIKQGEPDLILAREVVKGTDTLVLRDEKGNPVWSWYH